MADSLHSTLLSKKYSALLIKALSLNSDGVNRGDFNNYWTYFSSPSHKCLS